MPTRAAGSLKAENRLKVCALVLTLHNLEFVTNLVFSLLLSKIGTNRPTLLPISQGWCSYTDYITYRKRL